MEIIQVILILTMLCIPFLLMVLLFQTFFTLMNSEQFKTSEHSQHFDLELRLIKKITKESTNPFAFAALSSPVTLPMFFIWPKDKEQAGLFEGNIAVSLNRTDFHNLQVDEKYKLIKIVTRSYYKRRWFEKPILINLMLSPEDKMKDEYEEIKVRYKLNRN